MLKGKTIVLGISGAITAYKSVDLLAKLVANHCDVHVVLSENADKFVTETTLQAMSKNPVFTGVFDTLKEEKLNHVKIASKADLMLIAPASANTMARLAHGFADDMLSATALAATCPKLVFPSMNINMYENLITQANMERLVKYGYTVVRHGDGKLPDDAFSKGKLPDTDDMLRLVLDVLK